MLLGVALQGAARGAGWAKRRQVRCPGSSLAGGLFVAGINLTENLAYVLAHPAGSLRKMTLPRLPCLRAWVREQRPGPGARCTNVIAGDFVGADSFVGDVVGLNAKLLRG